MYTTKKIVASVVTIAIGLIVFNCSSQVSNTPEPEASTPRSAIVEQWVRVSLIGPIQLSFLKNGSLEADFGIDGSVEVTTHYEKRGDTLVFVDQSGVSCPDTGLYRLTQTDYYSSLDLISDDCGGRIKFILGFWTRPDHNSLEKTLSEEIALQATPEAHLNRARLNLAVGKPELALKDLDTYLAFDSANARVYVNRAGTKMPWDLKGVVDDCSSAIAIDPSNKNAYFLRGLARYELGEKMAACDDFETAIDLGFSVLRVAEAEKCSEFWE